MRQRLEDVTVRMYIDGVELLPMKVTSVTYEAIMPRERVKYAGSPTPEIDTNFEGWRGDFDTELVANAANIEDAMEAFLTGVLNRTLTGDIRIVVSGVVPGTATRNARRFDHCQIDVRFNGQTGRPTSRRLTWESQNSQRVL